MYNTILLIILDTGKHIKNIVIHTVHYIYLNDNVMVLMVFYVNDLSFRLYENSTLYSEPRSNGPSNEIVHVGILLLLLLK